MVNAYQCTPVMTKMNTEKHPQKKKDCYNLRGKGAPHRLGEMQENVRQLIKKANPPTTSKQQTQRKSGKTAADKSTSMSSKLRNIPPDNKNICSTPNTSVSLLLVNCNIVDDMKKTQLNTSFFELSKV